MKDFELLSWSMDLFRIPWTSIVLTITHLILPSSLLLPSTGFDQHPQVPRTPYLLDGVRNQKPFSPNQNPIYIAGEPTWRAEKCTTCGWCQFPENSPLSSFANIFPETKQRNPPFSISYHRCENLWFWLIFTSKWTKNEQKCVLQRIFPTWVY